MSGLMWVDNNMVILVIIILPQVVGRELVLLVLAGSWSWRKVMRKSEKEIMFLWMVELRGVNGMMGKLSSCWGAACFFCSGDCRY